MVELGGPYEARRRADGRQVRDGKQVRHVHVEENTVSCCGFGPGMMITDIVKRG